MQRTITIDAYAVLTVSPRATQDEIKSAYRKLARQHHPDVNSGSATAEELFKQLQAAYDLVKDAEARAAYDRSRIPAPKRQAAPKRPTAPTGGPTGPKHKVSRTPRPRAGEAVSTVTVTASNMLINQMGAELQNVRRQHNFGYRFEVVQEGSVSSRVKLTINGPSFIVNQLHEWVSTTLTANGIRLN